MPKGFNDQEKQYITEKLMHECQLSWHKYGYKKTSVDYLCQQIGISKGSFYNFFTSKEELFYQVYKQTLEHLYEVVEEKISQRQNKYGVADALKEIYQIYSQSQFMYDVNNPDFLSLYHKLNQEQQAYLNNQSYIGGKIMIQKPFLILKVDEDLALSLMFALLSTVSQKDKMLCHGKEVFDFMLDHLIDDIFE